MAKAKTNPFSAGAAAARKAAGSKLSPGGSKGTRAGGGVAGLPNPKAFGGPGAKQAVKGAGAKGPSKAGPSAASARLKPGQASLNGKVGTVGSLTKGTQKGFGIASQATKGMSPKAVTQFKAGIRSAMSGEARPTGRGVNAAFKAGHAFGKGVGKPGRPKKLVKAFLGTGGTGSHE